MKAWTFLVSRNQLIDYKTIVAPADFIAEAQIRSLLVKATDDNFIDREKVNIRWIEGSKAGKFTIIFRISKINGKEIGLKDSCLLKDSFGREIDLIEGLVIPNSPQEICHKIRQVHLDQAHRELMNKYRDFWYHSQVSDSQPIYLEGDGGSPVIDLHELQPFASSPEKRYEKKPFNIRRHREFFERPSAARKSLKGTKLLVVFLLSAVISLMIWSVLGSSSSSQAEMTCKSVITMQTKKIKNHEEGSNYLGGLEQEYLSKKSNDSKSKIWVYLVSENSEPQISNGSSSTVQPDISETLISKPALRTNDDSVLYIDSSYGLPDEAIKQLDREPKSNAISELKVIIIEPHSSASQCPFQSLGSPDSVS